MSPERVWNLFMLLVLAVVFAVIAAFAIGLALSMVESEPSCVTVVSHDDAAVRTSFTRSVTDFLVRRGFKSLVSKNESTWESPDTLVSMANGTHLWLNICAKDESSVDWRGIAVQVRRLGDAAAAHLAVTLVVNPRVSKCDKGSSMPLAEDFDLQHIATGIEHVKATCSPIHLVE
jgi:hypothetical protein